tara:strand:+ start:361 stop:921 length:561 start_codon:yes stop_codon:yes gene_type:complete
MGTLKTTNIQTITGSGTLTLGTSGETLALGSGVTSNLMYPAFHASLSAAQTISDVTITKVQFDTELFDTDNCYDNTTNYRFTPTVAGKYFIYTHIDGDTTGTNKTDQVQLYIRKNGSTAAFIFDYPYTAAEANNIGLTLNTTLDMNGTTDYVEVAAYIDVVSGFNARVGGASTYSRSAFGAYRIGT